MFFCMIYDLLTQRKQELDKCRPLPDSLIQNLDNWFRIELTYTSNALEGILSTDRKQH